MGRLQQIFRGRIVKVYGSFSLVVSIVSFFFASLAFAYDPPKIEQNHKQASSQDLAQEQEASNAAADYQEQAAAADPQVSSTAANPWVSLSMPPFGNGTDSAERGIPLTSTLPITTVGSSDAFTIIPFTPKETNENSNSRATQEQTVTTNNSYSCTTCQAAESGTNSSQQWTSNTNTTTSGEPESTAAPESYAAAEEDINLAYQYEDQDINTLLPLRVEEAGFDPTTTVIMPPLADINGELATHLRAERDNYAASVQGGEPSHYRRTILIPLNLNRARHWVGLVVRINAMNLAEQIYYVDSLGALGAPAPIPAQVAAALRSVYGEEVQLESVAGYRQTDTSGCGPLVIENLLRIARGIRNGERVTSTEMRKIRRHQANLAENNAPQIRLAERQRDNIRSFASSISTQISKGGSLYEESHLTPILYEGGNTGEQYQEGSSSEADSYRAFIEAVKNGHAEEIERILDRDRVEVDKVDEDGWTSLMVASESGQREIVKLLLERGAEIDKVDNDGWTALMIATEMGAVPVVELLLKEGANIYKEGHDADAVSIVYEGNNEIVTAAILASRAKYNKIVKMIDEKDRQINEFMQFAANGDIENVEKYLKEEKVTVNIVDKDGRTALMLASQEGQREIVKLLLERGAEIDKVDNDGWTALMIATEMGAVPVVELLLKEGANIYKEGHDADAVSIVYEGNNEIVTAAILASRAKYNKIVKMIDEKDRQINEFMQFAANGDIENVEKYLKEEKVTVNIVDKDGRTALLEAVRNDYTEIVEELLAHGAEPNKAENDGWTALMLASVKGKADIVTKLLAKGADVNKANNLGRTALLEAVRNDYTEIVEELLAHGAEPNKAENDGWTALMLASVKGKADIVTKLLAKGADVNKANNLGRTALQEAVRNDYTEIVEELLAHGAEPNKAENNGETALMLASVRGKADIVTKLLAMGADVNRRDNNGRTALKEAVENSRIDIVNALLKHPDVSPDQVVTDSCTALIWASKEGRQEIVETLLRRRDVNLNIKDHDGRTALIEAYEHNYRDIVGLLLECGANPDIADKYGNTLLMKAAVSGNEDMVSILLAYGADPYTVNKENNTAFMLAHKIEHYKIQRLFEIWCRNNVKHN